MRATKQQAQAAREAFKALARVYLPRAMWDFTLPGEDTANCKLITNFFDSAEAVLPNEEKTGLAGLARRYHQKKAADNRNHK